MRSKKVTFHNAEGVKISASIELPVDERPHSFALFAHCFTCSKNLQAVKLIARSLTQQGIGVMRFDFTGLGNSAGNFSDTNFGTNISDLVTAADFLAEHYLAPEIMIGHSLGGTATLYAARQVASAKAVVTIGSPYDPGHVAHLLDGGKEELDLKGEASVHIGGRPFTIKKQFLDDLEKRDSSGVVSSLGKSLLIMHSPQDKIVEIENAAHMYTKARHPKSFVSLDGADHLLSNPEDAIYVGNLIGSWARRYIHIPPTQELENRSHLVARSTDAKFLTELKVNGHQFLADEPEDVGGINAAPAPYDYLLAALGACTTMTVKMYADFKKIDLHEIRVHLSHEKKYAENQQNPDDPHGKIEVIQRQIELIGNLTPEQRTRLFEIANRCPVHKTLTADLKVESVLLATNP